MEIRKAAKGIITLEDNKIVLVAGKSGRLNLTGGGLRRGESARNSFFREAGEEIGVGSSAFIYVRKIFDDISGVTTNKKGLQKKSIWTVFMAPLAIQYDQLYIPEHSEITDITSMYPRECLEQDNMSLLAKAAIQGAIDYGYVDS